MLSKWPIRNKLLICLGLLMVVLAALSYSGFAGAYAYRGMVRTLSERVSELSPAADLGQRVADARVALRDLREADHAMPSLGTRFAQEEFAAAIMRIRTSLDQYKKQLDAHEDPESDISDSRLEWETVHKIENCMKVVEEANRQDNWLFNSLDFTYISDQLDLLQHYTVELPSFLHRRIGNLRAEVRNQYRALIITTWLTSLMTVVMLGVLVRLFYKWVFRPLRILIKGARKIATGNFEHRISMKANDEMAELANALNDMTLRFRTIRDDLDRQVRDRTKQALRSEKLASVGFLAAGVAHEINNPLAAVAVCAEALESRLAEALTDHPDRHIIENYLQMIQRESFRCKDITEKLLDFSRIGDRQKLQTSDLRAVAQEMVDLLAHHGKYRSKHIELEPGEPVLVSVNIQELKQVLLNLLVNGLDSLENGGTVKLRMFVEDSHAILLVQDNGCGMTEEVLEHLFEPFFTRRKQGQGTGLGLAITQRIVADHRGQIEAKSDGPGQGSEFRVTLPLAGSQEESHRHPQAA